MKRKPLSAKEIISEHYRRIALEANRKIREAKGLPEPTPEERAARRRYNDRYRAKQRGEVAA